MIYAIIFFVMVFLDQITKAVVDANNTQVELIQGVFSISNTRNEGAAFSFLHNVSWAQTFFIIITAIVLIALSCYLIFTKKQSKFYKFSIITVMAGAVGNLIDRIALKSVRDFIFPHFFANFNVADIFVCVGAFLICINIIFLDKEEGVFRKKKNNEN